MNKFANLTPVLASQLLNELEEAAHKERGMRPGNSLRDHLAEVVFKRFTVQKAPAPVADPDALLLDWLERNHTLHRAVEALYVVDGYEVTITHDCELYRGPWHGKTLREAYTLAAAAWDTTHGNRNLLDKPTNGS